MIIGIDATEFGIDRGGVRHYLFNLLKSLQEIDKNNLYWVVLHFWKKAMMESYEELQCLLTQHNFKVKWIRFPGTMISSWKLPIDLFTGPLDVYHGAGHFVDRVQHGESIITIHDLDYCMTPDLLEKEWVIKKAKFTEVSIRRASAVIAPTHFIKEAILSRFSIERERVIVVYHGVSPAFSTGLDKQIIMKTKEKYKLPSDYILFVGQINRNKNLWRLIEAFNLLKQTHDIPHCLVLAGAKRQFHADLHMRMTELGLQKDVLFPGYVDEADLPSLYRGAALFMFPSLYEGFGLPVLEAMASGVPVIASSSGSLPEVVGNAGLLVNPLQTEEIAQAMHRLLSDSQLREQLIQLGLERVKHFSWTSTALKTLNVYKSVSG